MEAELQCTKQSVLCDVMLVTAKDEKMAKKTSSSVEIERADKTDRQIDRDRDR